MAAVDGYTFLGFGSNPFNSNTAEREPEIASYAVHPPYLDRAKAASAVRGAFLLEGARGSGKSATRLTIAKQLFTGAGGPLVVPLTSFNVFKPFTRTGLTLDHYTSQVAFLVVESLLAWLSALSEQEQKDVIGRIKPSEKLVSSFVSSFYLTRADHSRSNTAQDTYQLLDTSRMAKATIWLEKKWDAVGTAVVTLAVALGKKQVGIDIDSPAAFEELLRRQKSDGFHDPLFTLTRAVEVARAFGFSGILVQIDKVDETDWTGADTSAAADLIAPLLTNINLHEVDGLTWTFFVWNEVCAQLRRAHGKSIRFDKIPNGRVTWQEDYLRNLVSRRVQYFSDNRVANLGDISDQGTDVDPILLNLIELTGRSPRGLISALDHVLSDHIQRNQGHPRRLDASAYETGMDSFALRSLEDDGLLEDARMISKLGQDEFVTKDVQGLIRQSAQTARARIDGWVEAQLIKSVGTRSTGSLGRPVDVFGVHDPRVARIRLRKL